MIAVLISVCGTCPRIKAAERPATVDVARLKRVHDELLAQYAAARRQFPKSLIAAMPYLEVPASLGQLSADLATKLEKAGVGSLLDDRMADQTQPALRVEILNDYGFWLSKTSEPKKAIPILQKVVALAPDRAIAWLNLADAVRSSLGRAVTWDEKIELPAIGLQAYSSYQALTGKPLPAAEDFKFLYADPTVSSNVCSYVAAFYTRGRQAELWGYPDPVDIAGDRRLHHVYIFDQGTAHIPAIVSSARRLSEQELLTESFDKQEINFDRTDAPSESGSWPELHMLPFRDGYYLVYQEDGGPVAIVKPNAGTVCRFKRSFTPVLTENRAPAICHDAFDGKPFDQVGSKPLAPGDITVDNESGLPDRGGTPQFQRYSDVNLDPKGLPGRIGYYEFNSGAGAGCSLNGIAFLDGNRLEKSPRAKALADIQDEHQDCRGSNSSLIRANGQVLIEWTGGRALQRTTPPRTLLRLAGDKIETVCRVEQRPTYSAETLTPSATSAPKSSLPWTRPDPNAFPSVKMPPGNSR
ncbi:hypothetical protein JQ621_24805 [Bradyrhizobium manausense]|uniref:hypothetical protein n=1 Tax=Bradyrhizobium manausense TaxID=989370 RepID=UPI001BABD90A|nr:hypothetical protein [Bradyrhizobium manausense]MBR1090700.1 hypothetical protein [Bradyrhizobium manausense]